MQLGRSFSSFMCAAIMLSALAPQAHAQADSTRTAALLPALQRLEPGATIRIFAPEGFVTGRFDRVTPDSLYLDTSAYALRSLQRVELRQRSTRRGMKTGALIGAPAAALYAGFFALLADAESDLSASETAALVVGGTAFGLVAGGTLGAVIGAAIPRWVDVTDPGVRMPARDPAAPPLNTIGSISVTPAYARLADGESGGVGVRAAYMFHSKHVSAGPEIGTYGLGESERTVPSFCPGIGACEITIAGPKRVSHAGGIARIGTGISNRIEPYATVGVGLYSWSGFGDYGGYSLGGGLQVRHASRRRSVFAEGRWQSNLTRTGNENSGLGFYTIGIGGALAW